jgi:hypothetical protein
MGRHKHDEVSSCSDRIDECTSESEDDAGYETDATDLVETGRGSKANNERKAADPAWLLKANDHPPEYYLRQLADFDESEFTKQDYSDGSTLLLDRIEDLWFQ